MWWTLLWQNKNLIGMGLIALVVALYIGALKTEIHFLNNKVTALTATNVSLTAESEAKQQNIVRLEGSLQALTEEGKRKQANATMWREKFNSSEKHWQEAIGHLKYLSPMAGESDCDTATRILREYRK